MSIQDPIAQSVEEASNPTKKAKSAQNTRWLVIIGVGAVLGGGVLYVVGFKKPDAPKAPALTKADEKRNIATATALAPQDLSPEAKNVDLQTQLQQMQAELDAEKQKNAGLLNEKEGLTQQVLSVQDQSNQADLSRKRAAANRGYQSSLNAGPLGDAAGYSPTTTAASPLQAQAAALAAMGQAPGQAGAANAAPPPPRRQMKVISFGSGLATADGGSNGAAVTQVSAKDKKDSDAIEDVSVYDAAEYVAPNSYVSAVVLSGVDMTTSATGTADPKPVLMRIDGDAQGVGTDGKFQVSHLKGCLVNGAARAELSSEKVYVQLQKITCPVGGNKYMTSKVEGYVTFKGKVGVRGRVVSREGDYAAKAFVAGTLQGLGQAESMNVQRTLSGVSTNASGQQSISTAPLSQSQMTQAAVGSGIGNGSSMLAQYYINKAEQYQPVVEMPTGVEVELVFISGFRYSYKVDTNGQ